MTAGHETGGEHTVALSQLGERLAGLRLREPSALEATCQSLARHGQLTPVVVFPDSGGVELLDGFKRLHAARTLGWTDLRAETRDVGRVDAKVAISALHDRRGLTEIEEGWLVQSLHRDDGLTQSDIAWRLGRHKSWVCRRLILVEALDPAVQADVRLGLLASRAAVALSALPRGNQRACADVVVRRGLTVRQTETLVAEVAEQSDEVARAALLARRLHGDDAATPGQRPERARSEADGIAADIHTLRRVAGRLHARLCATPLGAFGPATPLLLDGLLALAPVLEALGHRLAVVTGKEFPS